MSQVTLDNVDIMTTKNAGHAGQIYLGKDAEGRRCRVWVEFLDDTDEDTELDEADADD